MSTIDLCFLEWKYSSARATCRHIGLDLNHTDGHPAHTKHGHMEDEERPKTSLPWDVASCDAWVPRGKNACVPDHQPRAPLSSQLCIFAQDCLVDNTTTYESGWGIAGDCCSPFLRKLFYVLEWVGFVALGPAFCSPIVGGRVSQAHLAWFHVFLGTGFGLLELSVNLALALKK